MKKLILLCVSCLPLTAWSQSFAEIELLKEKEKIAKNIENYEGYLKTNFERFEKEQKRLKESEEKLKSLEDYEQNFRDARAFAIADLHNKIESLPLTKKIGKTGKFYKCLRDSLEEKNFLNQKYCVSRFNPKLSADEKSELDNWSAKTGVTLKDAEAQKKYLPQEIQRSKESLVQLEKHYKSSESQVNYLKDSLKITEAKIQETKLIPKNQHFINCNSSTPVINLENEVPYANASIKGPFFDVPRDNQDGLGTCYANAAKNLLVGVSKGEDVASFLDLALHYKNQSGELSEDGLDAGNSCSTLNAIKEKGYCPQGFSPLETGERNIAGEGLFNYGPYNYLATSVNLLRDFLGGLAKFEKDQGEVSREVLAKSGSIIAALKADPDIILPLPIVRNNVPEEWKLKEAHAMKKLETTISYDKFLEEHREAYRKFYPNYIKAVLAGKSLDDIFEIYKTDLKDFITKYQLQNNLEEFKRVFKLRAKGDHQDPKLKEKLTTSIQFLKNIMNKNDMGDEDFYEFCSGSGSEALRFLSSMQPLIEKIRDNKINEDKLFDKDGKFKSAEELMQMTVAPSCLNAENRKKVTPFTCDNGYNFISSIRKSDKPHDEKVKMLRERVVLSLVQGYPLGNSFPTSAGSGHINTIVGLRFNSQTNSCEYLIRESQNGRSEWEKESDIFNKIQGLTEIRRAQ